MKYLLTGICLALLVACNEQAQNAENNTNDTANNKTAANSSEEWIPVDSATAMNAMMEAGTPGAEQKMLAESDGNWKADITMWNYPDGPPMKAAGVVTNKMIMDGRYQETTFKGDMMGMPFEGSNILGYDKARKVWVSTWVDNMSTGIMTMEGTWDDASKSLTYKGEMLCPANGKMCEIKQVWKKIDNKTEVLEMYGPDMKTGKPYKNMEMKMTRS